MVVCHEGGLVYLRYEHPELYSLVGCLVVDYERCVANQSVSADEVEPAQKFFRDRECGLVYVGYADLGENPVEDVCYLQSVCKQDLRLALRERAYQS